MFEPFDMSDHRIDPKLASKRSFSWEFPNLVVSNLVVCIFYVEALFAPFCALLRSFADSRLRTFAVICALLRAFVCFCIRLRLERPRLGTPDFQNAQPSVLKLFSLNQLLSIVAHPC